MKKATAFALAIPLLLAAFLVGFLVRKVPPPPTNVVRVAGNLDDAENPVRRLAQATVLGQLRGDGMTLWEFSRKRILRLCPMVDPLQIEPNVVGSGPTPEGAWRLDVSVGYSGRRCGVGLVFDIAALWSDDGEIVPLTSIQPTNSPFEPPSGLKRREARPENSWYQDFLDGKDP